MEPNALTSVLRKYGLLVPKISPVWTTATSVKIVPARQMERSCDLVIVLTLIARRQERAANLLENQAPSHHSEGRILGKIFKK